MSAMYIVGGVGERVLGESGTLVWWVVYGMHGTWDNACWWQVAMQSKQAMSNTPGVLGIGERSHARPEKHIIRMLPLQRPTPGTGEVLRKSIDGNGATNPIIHDWRIDTERKNVLPLASYRSGAKGAAVPDPVDAVDDGDGAVAGADEEGVEGVDLEERRVDGLVRRGERLADDLPAEDAASAGRLPEAAGAEEVGVDRLCVCVEKCREASRAGKV